MSYLPPVPECMVSVVGDYSKVSDFRGSTSQPVSPLAQEQPRPHQFSPYWNMGEQPIFTCKAHVFHIDPMTKRSWIPASTAAVPVSFFYDSSRALYRIISVEGTKAVINSTVTPNMSFTKTSQKFGQWSDVRANTVYGLGFPSEAELNKFIEQFQEVKEATRATSKQTGQVPVANGGNVTIPPPAVMTGASPLTPRSQMQGGGGVPMQSNMQEDPDVLINNSNETNANSLLKGIVHQRSQSLSGVPPGGTRQDTDSPKHGPGKTDKVGQSPETQLKYENERLRLALAQSSMNAKKWEVELSTLKSNNARLTAALQESTANVEEWKKQLQAYKEENQRLKQRTLEAEAARGNADAAAELRKEISLMRDKVDMCQQQLKSKDEEIRTLKEKGSSGDGSKESELRVTLHQVQAQLEAALGAQDSQKRVLEALNLQLAEKIQDLAGIHKEVNTALQT
ncbi:unnamed protein product [Allacma fusca]|uniref:WH1 domain-containing protein n=1 Tax=Allacma fusca TaxID=39272 RepID=A0A8J2LKD2_9HEXA|nr:unnamed protein product [Allacma fusca]